MKPHSGKKRQHGLTLVELLVALGIFLLVIGAAFTLLGSSQARYQTESQVLNSFQEARLALDQIVRDVNDAGYPPLTYAGIEPTKFASTPFAWSPIYTVLTTCTIEVYFITTGDFDIIIQIIPTQQEPTCLGLF